MAIFILLVNNVKNSFKKVGLPTFVRNKKCAKNIFKKAGLHTIGIMQWLKIIITIVVLSSSKNYECVNSSTPALDTSNTSSPCPPSPPPPTTPPPPSSTSSSLLSWALGSSSNNKVAKIINGNGRKGYNIGFWNCRKGLVAGEKRASTKMVEVKQFIQRKSLHLLCLVESDLHSNISRYIRRNSLKTEEVHQVLGISGYKILLPRSWQAHGQARIMVFAKEELSVKIRDMGVENGDLPTITCEIGFGREKKTIVNFFYREFTSGVSGLSDQNSRVKRL